MCVFVCVCVRDRRRPNAAGVSVLIGIECRYVTITKERKCGLGRNEKEGRMGMKRKIDY